MRVEHWENAIEQGEAAGRRLLAEHGPRRRARSCPCPWFWSDQYDRKIQMAGRPAAGDELDVVDGSIEERRFVAAFRRGDRCTAVLGVNRPRLVIQARMKLNESLDWAPVAELFGVSVLASSTGLAAAGPPLFWALIGVTLVVAAADWWAVATDRRPVEYVLKPLTMVVLIGAALALSDPASDAARWWMVAGLVCSLAGDVFLMLDGPVRAGPGVVPARPHRLRRRPCGTSGCPPCRLRGRPGASWWCWWG